MTCLSHCWHEDRAPHALGIGTKGGVDIQAIQRWSCCFCEAAKEVKIFIGVATKGAHGPYRPQTEKTFAELYGKIRRLKERIKRLNPHASVSEDDE